MANLAKLLPNQHAQILGYSIIAYGVSFLLDLIDPVVKMTSFSKMADSLPKGANLPFSLGGALWASVAFGVVAFMVCLISGSVIKNQDVNPRGWGLVFVLLAFGFFPLGTILCAYSLIYLFVIFPTEGEITEKELTE